MNHDHPHASGPRPDTRRTRIVFWLFIGIAAFYLLAEHRTHVFGVLPFLIILACPLMHVFHHGHGSHRDDDGADPRPPGSHLQ